MSVHGLGSPNEAGGRAATADRAAAAPAKKSGAAGTEAPAAKPAAATDLAPAKTAAKPRSSSGPVGSGLIATTPVENSDPVPVSPKSLALAHAIDRMNTALQRARSSPGSDAKHRSTNSPLYRSVKEVLLHSAGGNTTEQALGPAANELIDNCLTNNDRIVVAAERLSDARNLRAVTDDIRAQAAISAFLANPTKRHLDNLVTWIRPHSNEVEGGYDLGHQAFTRILAAANALPPNKVAALMAALHDKSQQGNSVPISSERKEDIDALEARLKGATRGSELERAKKLIELCRQQEIELEKASSK